MQGARAGVPANRAEVRLSAPRRRCADGELGEAHRRPAGHIVHRARRDALWARDAQLETAVREFSATLASVADAPDHGGAAVLSVDVREQETIRRFFSTLTTLGAPQDVTLQELRIEVFRPADPGTEKRVREAFEARRQSEPAAAGS